jgi:Zn-dependent protease
LSPIVNFASALRAQFSNGELQFELTLSQLRPSLSAVDQNQIPPPPPPPPPPVQSLPPAPAPSTAYQGTESTAWQKIKRALAPLGVVLLLIAKFFAKIKLLLLPVLKLPVLKFIPVILKTGGTMVLTIWVYAMYWGVWFAVGFVLLIFVHECGHLLAAKRIGLKVGAPVFIPFMGAFIALKEAPHNAWIEAQVGIGGPLLGSLGAAVCEGIFLVTGNPMFRALAYAGFFLNLFNLIPVGFLDGGRIVTALSPWLWLIGFAILVAITVAHPNFLLILILVASVPRLFFLFKKKSEAERRYFEITPLQRWTIGAMYFGLIALLVLGMKLTLIPHDTLGD